jgi:PAS domain-containing protein
MADRPLPTALHTVLNVEAAVLDEDGVIVAVNEGWEAFSLYNGGDPARTGVGVSYLDVCDRADDDQAARTGAMIRAALDGELPQATSVMIPCHSASEHRWFELLVSSRLDDGGRPVGATVMFVPTSRPTPRQARRPASGEAPAHARVIDRLASAVRRLDDVVEHPSAPGAVRQIAAARNEVHRAIASLRRS